MAAVHYAWILSLTVLVRHDGVLLVFTGAEDGSVGMMRVDDADGKQGTEPAHHVFDDLGTSNVPAMAPHQLSLSF